MGDALKGSFDTIANKKKEVAESQHRAFEREFDYQGRIKTLQDQLEKCQKELKDERACAEKLVVTLTQI